MSSTADGPDPTAAAGGAPVPAAAGQSPKSARGEGDVVRVMELLLEERRSIDNVDAALVHLLAERFRHTQRVGLLKAEHGLPPADPERERQQVERLRCLARDAGLDPTFAEAFLRFIVTEVIRHHERIREEQAPES